MSRAAPDIMVRTSLLLLLILLLMLIFLLILILLLTLFFMFLLMFTAYYFCATSLSPSLESQYPCSLALPCTTLSPPSPLYPSFHDLLLVHPVQFNLSALHHLLSANLCTPLILLPTLLTNPFIILPKLLTPLIHPFLSHN